jgi:hypothetical protein
MAQDLRRQKEIAEQANLAKSTFLAAASHATQQSHERPMRFNCSLPSTPLAARRSSRNSRSGRVQ